jgi:hypothetical protein
VFHAKQAYWTDTVSIRNNKNKKETLLNEIKAPRVGDKRGVNLTLDVKQYDTITGGSSELNPPWREVPCNFTCDTTETHTNTNVSPVNVITNGDPDVNLNLNLESILTRESDPRKAERVRRIIQEVTIGLDVTQEQRQAVHELLEEYADCFALSIKEVNAVPGVVHKLNIPEGATFRTKIPPRSYNSDQRAFVNAKVSEMLEAGIIRPIYPSEVRFVAQTVLAQKAHDGQGLCIDELKYNVNQQCLENGLQSEFDIPPAPEPNMKHPTKQEPCGPIKWCMCQDFGGINKVTEVAPVPQGNICVRSN